VCRLMCSSLFCSDLALLCWHMCTSVSFYESMNGNAVPSLWPLCMHRLCASRRPWVTCKVRGQAF
jgi:hypothetical protein